VVSAEKQPETTFSAAGQWIGWRGEYLGHCFAPKPLNA
jgi:hypothetical protein